MKKNQTNFYWLYVPLLGVFVFFAFLSQAQQGLIPRVATRGIEEQDFGRLIFEWPKENEFEETRDGRTLTLNFSEPAVFALDRAAIQLNNYIESLSQTGVSTVIVRLSDDFTTRSFQNGNATIIDILRESALAEESAPEERGETIDEEARVFRVAPDRLSQRTAPPANINIRIGNHIGYDRIAIPWPISVAYSAILEGQRLTISFDTRFSADLGKLSNDLGNRLSRFPRQSSDGRSLELDFNSKINLRDFSYGNIVVLDLIKSSQDRETSNILDAQQADRNIVTVRNGQHPDYTRFVFDYKEPTNYIIERKNGRMQVTFANPTPLSLQTFALDRNAPFTNPNISQFGNSTRFSINIPDHFNYRHFESGTKIVVDLIETVERDDFYPLNQIRVTPGQFQRFPFPLPAPNLLEQPGRGRPPPVLYRANFNLPEAVGVAVFERSGVHWVIVDRSDLNEQEINISDVIENSSDLFSLIERIPHPGATILRFISNEQLFTSVLQRGLSWEVRFHRRATLPLVPVDLHIVKDNQLETTLSLLARNAGKSLKIYDPALKDDIIVGTLQNPGQGILRGRAYPEFNLLPSAQGIAIIPFVDSVKLQSNNSGFTLTRENGFNLNQLPIDDSYEQRGYRASGAPLLQFSAWSRDNENYLKVRNSLNGLLSSSNGEDNYDNLLLTAAGYHLSQGLAADSLGLLNLYQRRNPFVLNNLSFKLHKAASLLLLNRIDEAIDFLKEPQFSQYEEAVLWQGVAAALKKRWLVADSYFKQSDSFLDRYPIALRNRLGLLRIESALSSQEAINAGLWIERLEISQSAMTPSQRNALDYMRAWRASILREKDTAKKIWGEVAQRNDLLWSTRSQLQWVLISLNDGDISTERAIEELEHLRYLWRGNDIELLTREVLIDIYFNSGDYEKGFSLARDTVSAFSESPQARILSQKILESFENLLLTQKARSLTSLQTYKIYNDFGELTPPGQQGNKLIENVADRMILDNLYETAANTLTQKLVQRLTGEEKKRIAIKTSLLYILDKKPGQALDILQKTISTDDIASPLFSDARQLEAKAFYDQEQFDKALSLIAGDVSKNADLLRRDIYWQRGEWQRAAQAMERLVGPLPHGEDIRFDDQQSSLLVSWAIALRLADERQSLRVLRSDFFFLIQDNPLAQVFEFVTSEPDIEEEPANIEKIINLSLESGQFTVFLDDYHRRYFPPPLVVSSESKPQDEDQNQTDNQTELNIDDAPILLANQR